MPVAVIATFPRSRAVHTLPTRPLQLYEVSLDLLRCAGINRTPDVLHQVENRLRSIE